MLVAPNRIKQPRIVVAPLRTVTRPVSIMTPIHATAITAAVVAMVPSNVPSSH